jgi:hypothetical protein
MTPEIGHSLHTIAFVRSHTRHLSLGGTFAPGPLIAIGGYLVTLVVLLVLGVFMGWQKHGKGGGGGGGPGKPVVPDPPPPGGEERDADFASWEGQLAAGDEQPAPDRPEDSPLGVP